MSTAATPSIDSLAHRLEEDIRHRQLAPGDRYLTAGEAARLFEVSTTTAHRSMQVLARRGVLKRFRSRGSFVGPLGGLQRLRLRTVYVLFASGDHWVGEELSDLFIRAVRRPFPDANVQICFLPEAGTLACLAELVRGARQAGEPAGFLANSCDAEVYAYLAETGLPMVVGGTTAVDQGRLPSVDVDNHEAGRLLAQHLVKRGHQRMLLLWPAVARPGDNDFFDGVSHALTAARLPHDALMIRIAPGAPASFSAQMAHWMRGARCPTAIIARRPGKASMAAAALEGLGTRVPEDVEITFINHPSRRRGGLPYTCVQPCVPFEEMVGRMAGLLGQVASDAGAARRVTLPVELVLSSGERDPRRRPEDGVGAVGSERPN